MVEDRGSVRMRHLETSRSWPR